MSVRNSHTAQLLKLLDRQKPSRPTQQSIMDPPSTIYTVIKQMYNSFKKDNQSRILQNKVYELKIHDSVPKAELNKFQTPVKVDEIFVNLAPEHRSQVIKSMLILKTYLAPQLQKSLMETMIREIVKVEDLAAMLSLFSILIKSKECLADKQGIYRRVMDEVVARLLEAKGEFDQREVGVIGSFLFGLPVLDATVLELIGNLFEKIKNIQDFKQLKLLYNGIHSKIQSENNPKNNPLLLQSLIKITTEQHITIIQERATKIIKKSQSQSQNKEALTQEDNTFVELLYREAIGKMANFGNIGEEEFNEKRRKIVDFLFVALEAEAMLQGRKGEEATSRVWSQFISWNHLHTKCRSILDYISLKMSTLITQIFQHPKPTLHILNLLLTNEAHLSSSPQPPNSPPSTLEQSVSQHPLRILLSKISGFDRYLNNRLGRQLVAFALMIDQNEIYQPILVNPANLEHIDVVLQTFGFVGVYEFYRKMLTNTVRRGNLEKYLIVLQDKKPNKYKDFFVKVDSWSQGQIFQIHDHFLLRTFWKTPTPSILLSFLRQLPSYLPSKYTIDTMHTFLKYFQSKPEHKAIYTQCVRTLHVILSTRQAGDLAVQFKRHLKEIIEGKVIGNQVFKGVPEGMIEGLREFYAAEVGK